MSEFIPVDDFDLILLGGTGDLARRKLLPALFNRFLDGQISEKCRIIATASSNLDSNSYRDLIRENINKFNVNKNYDADDLSRFLKILEYFPINLENFSELKDHYEINDNKILVYYLAISPRFYSVVANSIREIGYNPTNSRIVVEKPIGTDFLSAKRINEDLAKAFSENQIYRIDHYLGKETVQNLLALRFANVLFENVWSNSVVDHVQITVAEEIGLEGRESYYDKSGCIRDMVQNHLLQILCLVAMEPPIRNSAEHVRDEKLKVLRAIRPIKDNINNHLILGQYINGKVNGKDVISYLDEKNIDKSSRTETFCALKLYIDNWRWANVPFFLRTGKRLKRKYSEIVLRFKSVPHSIFSKQGIDDKELMPNSLVLKLQPEEIVQLRLMTKKPGPGGFKLQELSLDLNLADQDGVRYNDAYERLLMDVFRGNPALFMRRDEVEESWNFIDDILLAKENQNCNLYDYKAGTMGPDESDYLLKMNNRKWMERKDD